ncbi:HNH endonuclease signature motif containing protein [Amycolatopsis alkalitolerans]|uniref:DUF222 domain-containing protein n=1 Tax=Amycolatopsis alkalitolerans TaxID=2547244 RepID=A0A5C4M0Q1_9PSEU|nr:HNH endonuclease signature motif containing protein [Amycolatopsis alkalitolerans]TNC24803.1 DUF222 domain-containing protein [Amycolatopsis alkalitolerans]
MTGILAPTLWRLPDAGVTTKLLACEEKLRRGYAEMLALVGEVEHRGLGRSLGYQDSAALLQENLRISGREAQTRVAHASATVPSFSVTGIPQPSPLAGTAEALAAGELNREHVQAITAVFSTCPSGISSQQRAEGEAALVTLARQAGPEAVRTAGRRLIAHWEQETEPREKPEKAPPRRSLQIAHRPDGSARFRGELDAESTVLLDGLLGPLAKPHDAADLRGLDERRGDALADILELAARCDELSVQGGERAVLIVRTTLAELEGRLREALLTVPGVRSVDTLLRYACDARVIPAVLGAKGQPLFLGRASRLAGAAQRHALVVRDKGCAHPGCDRGPKWTTPHHVIPWSQSGPTDLGNLVLLCARHHRMAHHSGWDIRFRHGIPEFLPPSWLDSARTPRRNLAHTLGPPEPACPPPVAADDDPWAFARAG